MRIEREERTIFFCFVVWGGGGNLCFASPVPSMHVYMLVPMHNLDIQ
jgi:hypothetical protein